MKKYIAVILALALSACTSETPLGKCIGVNGEPQSDLVYEYSTYNIVLGIIFVETIFVPIIVVLDELKCPVLKKGK